MAVTAATRIKADYTSYGQSKYGAYCGHVPSKAQRPAQPQKRGSSQGVVVVVVVVMLTVMEVVNNIRIRIWDELRASIITNL